MGTIVVDKQKDHQRGHEKRANVTGLLRHYRDRLRLRNLLLEGAQSKATGLADADYFTSLRSAIKKYLTAPAEATRSS